MKFDPATNLFDSMELGVFNGINHAINDSATFAFETGGAMVDCFNGEGESARDRAGNFYPDVNGDGVHTAGDVLRTVNFLGKKPGSGEGEQLSVESPVTKSTTDEVFSDIGVSVLTATDKVVVTDCPKAPEVVDSSELNSVSHSSNEDEENGLLDLLADDVERIWN